VLFDTLALLEDPEPHSAALNMAIDEVLLRTATQPLLRCYRWARPAVSFGYFGKFAEAAAAWPGREMVRRWTGGGIVPHGEDFTCSLIVPKGEPLLRLSAAESYRAIHEAILPVLAPSLAGVALSPHSTEKISGACFENPVRHDLVVGGEKVAGAAQRRTRHGLLHQGSIQFPSLPSKFTNSLAEAFARKIEPTGMTEAWSREAESVAVTKYGADEWLRRA
jgi:lipoate-protein ligase A